MQRLKSRRQFQAVLAASTVARTNHFALHSLALSEPVTSETVPAIFDSCGPWLGAMVPKRWAKRAVTRNAIKRQIYSVASGFEPGMRQAAHVVRLRSSFDKSQFVSASSEALKSAVRTELQQLLVRATGRTASQERAS